jgi:hypothetical protein
MPTRIENRHRYPKNWPEIRARIRERSGGRCECTGQCGLHRGKRCIERNGEPAIYARGKVVLTVAHFPDHAPENCADENLIHACNRCHLRMDRQHHKVSAIEAQGQQKLDLVP